MWCEGPYFPDTTNRCLHSKHGMQASISYAESVACVYLHSSTELNQMEHLFLIP